MTRNLIQMLVGMPPALDVLLKASLVLCLGWALHFVLARSNPRWRVLLWRGVATGVLLVPLLGAVMPALKLTVPQSPIAAVISPNHGNNTLLESEQAPLLTSPDMLAIAQPQQSPRQYVFIAVRQHLWLSLSILWAGVSVLLAVKLFISLRGVRRMLLSSTPVAGNIQEIFNDLHGNLGFTRKVDLRASDELSSPFLYGFRRPVIILPERMTLDDYIKELPAIFVHELTHLKGCDLIWMTLVHSLSIAFWFHPLTWRMGEAHASACEAVCDAVAARHIGSPLAYSRTLARIALELVALPPAVGGIAMARMPEVRRRLETLKRKIDDRQLARRWVNVAMVLGFSALSLIAGVRLVFAEVASTPNKKDRIGVYDSRSVAIAYVGSGIFKDYLQKLRAQLDEAKTTGDKKKVAEIESKLKAKQKMLHKQGFGIYPVDDILAHIKDQLPEIKKKVDVSRIISRWDKKAISQDKSAEIVDVTQLLINAFNPDDKARQNAETIQKQKPTSRIRLWFLRD